MLTALRLFGLPMASSEAGKSRDELLVPRGPGLCKGETDPGRQQQGPQDARPARLAAPLGEQRGLLASSSVDTLHLIAKRVLDEVDRREKARQADKELEAIIRELGADL